MQKSWDSLWREWTRPIDWDAVVVEQWARKSSRYTRKGDKRSAEDLEKIRKAKARNKRQRQRAALERAEAARRARVAAKGHKARGEARLAVLEAIAGGADTLPRIRDASAVDYGTVKGLVYALEREGAARRAATGRRVTYRKGLPIDVQLERPAAFRWVLTPQGQAELAWRRREAARG